MKKVRRNKAAGKSENGGGAGTKPGERKITINGLTCDAVRTDYACIMLRDILDEFVYGEKLRDGAICNLESLVSLLKPNTGFAKEVAAMEAMIKGEMVLFLFCDEVNIHLGCKRERS